ncbi:radical SAM family heme chaperone HemW [Planktosalinus lacus]|uniref:radical SAM family heme chaperone HemW n=1 Tax=Planktosalinus lacus TaxID=1526573 RepID=UPI00166ADC1A|nr:radical SAM family heme chaperone HemW [Planktosalinus lacus]
MSGIYIHIPFCKQACHYCDFHFSTSLKKKTELVEALCRELVLRKDEIKGTIETIYFGGGTPSLLTREELDQIFKTIFEHYTVAEPVEVTLEANPDDLTEEKIKQLSDSSINRLSIGIQSFFEEDLKLMNRAHNAAEAEECLTLATRYFDNISLDLIYGIPGLSNKRWQQNIEKALSFGIPHISSYALTVEPKTALDSFIKKGIVPPIDEELAEQHFHTLIDTLTRKGFVHYELSNFGKEGYFSKNNTAYWQGKPYLGIGPSAHSFDGTTRSWNLRNNSLYIKSIEKNELPSETETLTKADRYNEYVMTGLRTMWGVSVNRVEKEFGVKYKEYLLKQVQKYLEEHLLYLDGDSLLVTKKGKFLSDGISSDLFFLNL